MVCIAVYGIKFDQKSLEAIEDIQRINSLSSLLSRLMPLSVMTNIFVGNNPLESAYNITQTDF